MNVKQCEKGHYYNTDIYSFCPYCNQTADADATVDLFSSSGNDVGNDLTVMEIMGERELGKQLTQMYVDDNNSADDNEKTIGLSFSSDGINPVVGWLVCEDGPERGRSYPLYSGRNFIGRSHSSGVSVYDDSSISRENHCSIIYEPNQCIFYIMPSPNATTIYKGKILRDAEILENEEIFTIGKSTFRIIAYCKKGRSW